MMLSRVGQIGALVALGMRHGMQALGPQALRAFGSASHLHCQLEPLEGANEGIFTLSLTRPEAKNAIGRQFLRELRECLDNVARESTTRCVVVCSAVPGIFCAGADLKERASMTHEEAGRFVSDLRAALAALEDLPMPTVAAVDGFALGGGAELALACDVRVCGLDAQFAFPETRLGIIPGAGGTQRLPRVVGRSRAKEMIFSGRRVDVHEAYRIGLADHMSEEQGADELALKVARGIAQSAPIALRMAKAAMTAGMDVDLRTGLRIEEACYAQVLPTQDRLEGLRAFAEKRQPVFTGQ